MSGSAIANVVTTGAVTIPTMKRLGYPPYYAGAIEACASTGGQLTPPIMGAVAFIMVDFPNIPYLTILTIIVIIATGVYLYMRRTGIDLEALVQPLGR